MTTGSSFYDYYKVPTGDQLRPAAPRLRDCAANPRDNVIELAPSTTISQHVFEEEGPPQGAALGSLQLLGTWMLMVLGIRSLSLGIAVLARPV